MRQEGRELDISKLEQFTEETIDQTIAEIKSKSKTYREAMEQARRITWPDQRPSRIEGKLLDLIGKEVIFRLEAEYQDAPIQK